MKLKNEKGAVTLFVLVSCLFFLTSVACVNMYLSSKQSAVNKEYQQIKKNYENDLDNASNIYNDLKNSSSNISFGVYSSNNGVITVPITINTTNYKSVKYFWLYNSTSLSDNDLNNYLSDPQNLPINWTYVEKSTNPNLQASVVASADGYYYLCVMLDTNPYWNEVSLVQPSVP